MSPAEAQAVFELWRKQQDTANVSASQPRVEDLAEAMGVDRAQVEAMLSQVRYEAQTRNEPKVRRKKRMLALFAVVGGLLVWSFLMYGMYRIGFGEGRRTSAFRYPYLNQAFPNELPSGVVAEFRGYSLVGSGNGNYDLVFVENNLVREIGRVIAEQAPVSFDHNAPAQTVDLDQVRKNLAEGKSMDGVFKMEPLDLSYRGQGDKVMVPIVLTGTPEAVAMVNQEVDRLVKVAASRLVKMISNEGRPVVAPTPTPPSSN